MEYSILAFPASLVVAIAFCIICYLSYDWYKRSRIISSNWLTAVFMGVIAVMTAIEGAWKIDLQHRAMFWIPVLITTYLVGMTSYDAIIRKLKTSFILAHTGMFLIFFGAFFGAPDFQLADIVANKYESTRYALSDDGLTVPLSFGIRLQDFSIEYYGDGASPKQYSSKLEFIGDEGAEKSSTDKVTSVNHPCLYKGWLIYQSDYDHLNNEYSVLRMVRDPWIPVIFLGMLCLALGAILGLKGSWKSKFVMPVALMLAIVFGCISITRINLGAMAPALRSLWFIPHLIVYMIAYALLAIALVCIVIGIFNRSDAMKTLPAKLLATSSVLLIVGMLCGAVWAKIAWGDYWTWDAKECWAATTWMLTLIGTHLPDLKKKKQLAMIILAAFLAMQVTWYGVNYLPSSKYSMHTYNTK